MSKTRRLRTAVIGVGHLGRHHARIHAQHPDAELVAVVDVDEEQARRVAEQHHTRALTDFMALVGDVDAVSIVVPTRYHLAIAQPFLERGTAVLVEKPMTATVEEGETMMGLAADSGAILQVGHVERFNPALMALSKYDLKPQFIECVRQGPFPFRATDVSVVFDLMIHDLDVVEHLAASPIKHLEAIGVPVMTAYEDIANARLTFENGCVANVTASRVSLTPKRQMRIFCPDCYAAVDYQKRTAQVYRRSDELQQAHASALANDLAALMALKDVGFGNLLKIEDVPVSEHDALEAEIAAFLDCVRTGNCPIVSAPEGLRAVRTATRISDAIRKTRPTML